MGYIFSFFAWIDRFIWEYLGIFVILIGGVYLTYKAHFLQIRTLKNPIKNVSEIFGIASHKTNSSYGLPPWKLYFSSIGGMVGVGNIVTIMGAVTLGGMGSILWMLLASFIGMIVKYCEVYLAIQYRVKKRNGDGYDGGLMYYIAGSFKESSVLKTVLPLLISVLLCIYGVEIVQFLVITDSISTLLGVDKAIIVAATLCCVMASALGGVKRLSEICAVIMPVLLVSYIGIGLYVIAINYAAIPEILYEILYQGTKFYDFHNDRWNIVGVIIAMHYGFARGIYSGDIGMGYDSVVHSEAKIMTSPASYARTTFFSLFTDTVISMISLLIAKLGGAFQQKGLSHFQYVSFSLEKFLPSFFVECYITLVIVIAGFSTIIGYFVVGQKAASYIHAKYGRVIYVIYAIFAFSIFAFQEQEDVMLIMSISGGIIMIVNIITILRLRARIKFQD
ncbi:putative sodium/glutamine symporter [Candidatus Fokinia solitaria]|uniref:Putative sodium/glutamine symporter n=1 Tax=Candidatus Fokinia solitaria TaxID=1802984 RepID=A0A2U8BTF0_9RICK|nr:alanine:cation symporter family protein [Candidatus Fokinia solitaria]AWD33510.1 putative sodium/glutamine symporter [Candidatus Fokinia solitaria]